jgi:AcrR family transcriptional regulator
MMKPRSSPEREGLVERFEAGGSQEMKPPFGKGSRSAGRVTKGERTKRRLMAATRKVLAEKGYHATRIEDIAKAAGVAKGTLYLYFKDKKAIIMEVMQEVFADGEQEMRSYRRRDDPFLDILGPNVSYARIVFEKAGLFRAYFQFANIYPEALEIWSETTRKWLARVEAAMDRRLGKGRTDEATRVLVTHAMSWMVDGILLSILALDQPRLREVVRSPEHLAETLSVLWYRAVYGEDPNADQLDSGRAVLDFHLSRDPSGARG